MPRLFFAASQAPAAQEALTLVHARFAPIPYKDADVVVALGGDGFMLETLHTGNPRNLPVYGMNRGTVGFLLNSFDLDGLDARVADAAEQRVVPLEATLTFRDGRTETLWAINEVSLLRAGPQAARIAIHVNGIQRLEALVGDGLMLSTPAGSTAYNASVNGPILPLGSNVLALSAIAAYRPRRWKGAVLPDTSEVVLTAHDPDKRPVMVSADSESRTGVVSVRLRAAPEQAKRLLFDANSGLEERLIAEQFL